MKLSPIRLILTIIAVVLQVILIVEGWHFLITEETWVISGAVSKTTSFSPLSSVCITVAGAYFLTVASAWVLPDFYPRSKRKYSSALDAMWCLVYRPRLVFIALISFSCLRESKPVFEMASFFSKGKLTATTISEVFQRRSFDFCIVVVGVLFYSYLIGEPGKEVFVLLLSSVLFANILFESLLYAYLKIKKKLGDEGGVTI